MPHQCVRCNSFYQDNAKEIAAGCSSCGGKLFFYVKEAKIKESKELVEKLSDDERAELETEVADIIGEDPDEGNDAVILDLESIRIQKAGKYELDLVQLFMKDKPVIYKLSEGKYFVDVAETFRKFSKKK